MPVVVYLLFAGFEIDGIPASFGTQPEAVFASEAIHVLVDLARIKERVVYEALAITPGSLGSGSKYFPLVFCREDHLCFFIVRFQDNQSTVFFRQIVQIISEHSIFICFFHVFCCFPVA